VNTSPKPRAVFFDRDGTLTVEGEWIQHPDALVLVPGAGAALAKLASMGFLNVMFTNQSAVARGIITEGELAAIHARLQSLLGREGARLDGIYVCPHHPTEGVGKYRCECDCRKPKPGMILRAQRELDIDLDGSWCVGDMERDLAAGAAAGLPGILVATGKGVEEEARMRAAGKPPRFFVPDVGAAADTILRESAARYGK
jgi:D-glycero-D-manno-heptose 1,7-bisphosphate phosphatase